ncbi:MAG: hypothetical protein IEMM0001_1733 [bacterium]|nr:MAG: hypothetical protein IEMM0001_1733 [bacterium]
MSRKYRLNVITIRCFARIGFALLFIVPPVTYAQEPQDDREMLLKRIEVLEKRLKSLEGIDERLKRLEGVEQRVETLESTTVLSEPETRVKRIEVWVDENGVEHDKNAPGTRSMVTYQREKVYRRQTINQKIDQALEEAASRSVQVSVDGAIVLQGTKQTEGDKTEADGKAYQLASTDIYFTAGLAKYTVFFADIVGLSGTPPDAEVDGLTLLNGYSARLRQQNLLELREAWILTELWSQKISLVAGRLDLTNYFDTNTAANDETSQFLSDALVNNPTLGLSENGAGFAAWYDPKTGFRLKLGYQQSSSTATNLSDSLFYLTEASYRWTPFRLGEGNYRLWYRTDNSSGNTQTAYGVSFDQKLSAAITLFGRYGSAESAFGDDKFYSGGLQFRGGVVFNPEDAWGIGYANYELGAGDKETLAEAYYNLRMSEKLQFSFNLTQVTEDSADAGKVGYLVPGIRLQASF